MNKLKRLLLAAIISITAVAPVRATVLYVDVNSTGPNSPYTNWATAARTIQDAIDAASPGDEVIVTNGVYQSGGRVVYGALTNRVAVTKPLKVRSVNGPEVTVIAGYGGYPYFERSVRCVYLAAGAALVGFTLTNGASLDSGDAYGERSGGGVWCASASAVLSNCVLSGNSAIDFGGGAYQGTLNNCTLTGNAAYLAGGGASYSTLNNCTLTGNSSYDYGGGAWSSTLSHCTLTENSAQEDGGGASASTINNCTLAGNSAYDGGGAGSSTLNNCVLSLNSASDGGGAYSCTLRNCTITGNSALNAGGADSSTMNNCTITANEGGGASDCTLNNCIVFHNVAGQGGANYDSSSSFNYCCTTPIPSSGVGNISAEPQLASASHLSAGSPCRGAGSAAYVTDVDIDGEAWANPPSIGCDEFYLGATGPLSAAIRASYTNAATVFEVKLTAQIRGHADVSRWDFGDGTTVTNYPYTAHGWAAPGDYCVVLWVYNKTYPDGVSATVTVHVVEQRVYYVAADNGNPVVPYSSWATAATNIKDAVDAVSVGGALVLVSNGVYQAGGRVVYASITNRLAVTKPITVRSINGPELTSIVGSPIYPYLRCVYLADGAMLAGFTLINGATESPGDYKPEYGGGGVWCAAASVVVSNCVLTGNSAGGDGGGAYGGTLNYCTLTGNSAVYEGYGGGAYGSALNNCTLTGNSAYNGGGAFECTLINCTLTGNDVGDRDGCGYGGGAAYCNLNNCITYYNDCDNYAYSLLNYCCTDSMPLDGLGNITGEPAFIDPECGNFRLASSSPCINAGNNTYAPGGFDLDGNPRNVGGTVDIGAYEFQSPQSLISYAWLQQYGLAIDPTIDSADPDGDGLNNWQEWQAGTSPTDALSTLRLLTPIQIGLDLVVRWASVPGKYYFLDWTTNLGAPPIFEPLATHLPASATNTTTFTHTNATSLGPLFYRVGVE